LLIKNPDRIKNIVQWALISGGFKYGFILRGVAKSMSFMKESNGKSYRQLGPWCEHITRHNLGRRVCSE